MAKTLEQIQAELETLKTQFTDFSALSPVSYYTHQYSGEEIDAAVGAVPTLVRPNLLDNWYFGNPVDQRNGYIVPAGVQYYKVDGYVPQGPMPTTTKVDWIDNAGSARFNINGVPCYVPKDGGYVRGYVGSFVYTIDRWFLGGEPSNVMEITDGGIHVSYQQPGWNVIQKLKNVLCKGNTYTFSVVYKSTLPVRLVVTWGDGKYFFNESSPATSEWALVTITGTVPNNAEIAYEQVALQPLGSVAGTFDIKAAKLELGQTQTLAHQENGQWVLNEVPEEGEELRRCQRYFARLSGDSAWSVVGIAECYGTNIAALVFWLPVPMRTIPSIAASGLTVNGVAVSSITNDQYNPTCLKYKGTLATNVPAGIYAINQAGSGYVDVSADL